MEEKEMDLLMGIGPEVSFAPDIKRRLRIGTIKQIRDVGTLYKDGLMKIKFAIHQEDADKVDEQINKWVEILNIICIDGFSREEFEDSVPEQMESAVDRFLFS